MYIPYSTYFRVIAFPSLLFVSLGLFILLRSVFRHIDKNTKEKNELLSSIVLCCIILLFCRETFMPAVRVLMDVGCQHQYAEGKVAYKKFDQSYEHGKYSGWIIYMDSEKYYILEDEPILIGEEIQVEYLPHSHMIISWKR